MLKREVPLWTNDCRLEIGQRIDDRICEIMWPITDKVNDTAKEIINAVRLNEFVRIKYDDELSGCNGENPDEITILRVTEKVSDTTDEEEDVDQGDDFDQLRRVEMRSDNELTNRRQDELFQWIGEDVISRLNVLLSTTNTASDKTFINNVIKWKEKPNNAPCELSEDKLDPLPIFSQVTRISSSSERDVIVLDQVEDSQDESGGKSSFDGKVALQT